MEDAHMSGLRLDARQDYFDGDRQTCSRSLRESGRTKVQPMVKALGPSDLTQRTRASSGRPRLPSDKWTTESTATSHDVCRRTPSDEISRIVAFQRPRVFS